MLIPLSLCLLGGIVAALVWSINSGQFEDLVGPADRVAHEVDFIQPATDPAPYAPISEAPHGQSVAGPGSGDERVGDADRTRVD